MAKNIISTAPVALTVVSTPTPTAQQKMLIDLAMRTDGVTRAEVREALHVAEGANIPVQSMLKHIAERFGYVFENELFEIEGSNRKIAFYTMREPVAAKKAPAKAKVAAMATKATAPAKKAAAAIVTASKPAKKAARASA